jgi:hypothetical protein
MTWLPTASGRVFDLLRPDWREVDLVNDAAEHLARIARFSGAVSSGPYSVAQHSVVGADCIFRDTGDRAAAAAFLLHDGHEYVLTDKTSPNAAAEIATAEQLSPGAGQIVRAMQRLMKQRIDVAIYRAAGMGNDGCPEQYRQIVAEYDLRMLATERAHLLGRQVKLWHPAVEEAKPLRLVGGLTVWPWPMAADEFRDRLRRYLPERFGAPSPRPKPAPRKTARRTLVEA